MAGLAAPPLPASSSRAAQPQEHPGTAPSQTLRVPSRPALRPAGQQSAMAAMLPCRGAVASPTSRAAAPLLGWGPASHIPLSRADAERDGGSTAASTFPRQSSESGFAAHQRHLKMRPTPCARSPHTEPARAPSAIMPTLRGKKTPRAPHRAPPVKPPPSLRLLLEHVFSHRLHTGKLA